MSAGDDNCASTVGGERVADTDVSMSCIPSSHHVSSHGGGFDEITEIIEEAQVNNNRHNHLDHHNLVYVAVGYGDTSMDALMWTLTHALLPPTTLVYLVHIFSHPKFFPSPLGGGRVPKSQVSPQLAETYMAQDRSKRRELLNNYIHKCTAHLVQVETILIESDSVTDAITELISVVNIRKLVIGISNSNLRKVREGKGRGSGIVGEEIMQRAPAGCEVNIICQGNNVTHQLTSIPESMSPVGNLQSTPPKEGSKDTPMHQHSSPSRSFSCCFKPKG